MYSDKLDFGFKVWNLMHVMVVVQNVATVLRQVYIYFNTEFQGLFIFPSFFLSRFEVIVVVIIIIDILIILFGLLT